MLRVIAALILLLTVATSALAVSSAPSPCQEDMACWDCSTMGNGICGGK
jgi:Spy/CpxP family protein refolding chaperone